MLIEINKLMVIMKSILIHAVTCPHCRTEFFLEVIQIVHLQYKKQDGLVTLELTDAELVVFHAIPLDAPKITRPLEWPFFEPI